MYLGDDLTRTQTALEEDEEIELAPVKLADVERMILGGDIKDAKSIAGLLVAMRMVDR